jgi:hypothetical protein
MNSDWINAFNVSMAIVWTFICMFLLLFAIVAPIYNPWIFIASFIILIAAPFLIVISDRLWDRVRV